GVSAGGVLGHVLRAVGYAAVAHGAGHGGDDRERDAEDRLAGLVLGHGRAQLFHEGLGVGGQLVHFPVPGDDRLAVFPVHAERSLDYLSSRQATPGSSRPSRNSREAPPPVLMWVILSA